MCGDKLPTKGIN